MMIDVPEIVSRPVSIHSFGVEILAKIEEIRDVFENHFDRAWVSVIIDDLPIGNRTIREIRHLVSLTSLHPGDENTILIGIQSLEVFIINIRRSLLPVLKEALGLSPFLPHKMVKDKMHYIFRRLVLYTFPFNLERLALLTAELKSYMNLSFA
ncbi:MAG: hypothetical protein AB1798_03420 [Spirochaetota bacterium]